MSLWVPEGRMGEVTSREFGMDINNHNIVEKHYNFLALNFSSQKLWKPFNSFSIADQSPRIK